MLTNEQRDEALDNAPSDRKLTPDLIKSKIAMEKYIFPADHGPSEPKVLTVCVLTLKNGFQVVGKSACADPANFNAELGQKIAYDDAFRQIWALEGYLLREQLYTEQQQLAA